MSEWLTTGEMIDRLKVGEVAQAYDEEGKEALFRVQRTSEFHTPFRNLDNDNNELFFNERLLKLKWRILPRYVSFEEAMKALREGKKVRFHVPEGKNIVITSHNFIENIYTIHGCSLSWGYLLEGKWTIED